MKKLLLFVCVIALVHGLCGCGDQTPQGTDDENANINTPADDDNTSEQLDENGSIIVVIPADAKDGDVLNDYSIYFDEVVIKSIDEANALLNKYKPEGGPLFFTTPEYTGFVEKEHDGAVVRKKTENTAEWVMMLDNGIVNTDVEKYENGQLVYKHSSSTEADYYVDTYYNGNVERHEFIGLDGTVREVEEYDKGEGYSVLTYVKYDGGEQWFTYADKANKVLATMRVVEDNGMDYTFTFDGAGNTVENVVSMTLTQNGTTTTYSHGNIPVYSVVSPPGRLPRG